jgi:hypothetical protein
MNMDGFGVAATSPLLLLMALAGIAWLVRRRVKREIGSLNYSNGIKVN